MVQFPALRLECNITGWSKKGTIFRAPDIDICILAVVGSAWIAEELKRMKIEQLSIRSDQIQRYSRH